MLESNFRYPIMHRSVFESRVTITDKKTKNKKNVMFKDVLRSNKRRVSIEIVFNRISILLKNLIRKKQEQ